MGTLREAVLDANRRIAEAVQQSKELEGMGTTLTALRFSGAQVGLVHVGDSRGYLMRGEQLSQITHDDTYVQHLVDSGKLTPDEAKDHPRKSVILRALLGTEVEPDVSIREARAGDRYLLCTDGLSDVVTAETMLETLRIPDLQECADRLVELALRGGGPDNVTVIVADVVNARAGETNDDLPVLDGAFADPAAADIPGADSAAERAARMSRGPANTAPSGPDKPGRRRRPWRTAVVVAGILAVLIAGLGIGYRVTQAYYFVGRDGTEVAIFRGVNTQFGPLKFFDVYKNTDLKMKDLQPAVRSQVQDGITAHNEPGRGADRVALARSAAADLPAGAAPPPTTTPPRAPPTGSGRARPPPSRGRRSSDHGGHEVHEAGPRVGQVQHPRERHSHADGYPDADSRARRELPGRLMANVSAQLRVPTRRNAELLLLAFAVLITVAAEAAVEATRDGRISSHLITYAAVPLVIGLITHLVIRKVARYADPLLLPIVVLLNGLGLVMIHRLDLGLKQQAAEGGATYDGAAAPTQVVWTAMGVLLFVVLLLVVRDHRVLQRYAYTLALAGVFLLMLPAVLPARFSEVNGARIWIRVAGFSLQPGEFAKILLTIFGASYLVAKRDVLALAGKRFLGIDFPRGRDFGPLLAAWLVCIGVLIRGHDLGTSLMFFGLFVVLLYVATERPSWVIVGPCCSPAAPTSPISCSATCRPAWASGCTRSHPCTSTTATSCASPCSDSAPAASSAPGSAAGTPNSSRCRPLTSSSRPSARRSACSAWSAC